MAGPDDDLLVRLKALKPISSALPTSATSLSQDPDPEPADDLAQRFLRFHTRPSSSPAPQTNHPDAGFLTHTPNEDDQTVEELLASLDPEEEWALNADDADDVQRLLHEAQKARPENLEEHNTTESIAKEADDHKQPADTADLDPEEHSKAPDSPTSEAEDEEAVLILQRILDEISLGPQAPLHSTSREPQSEPGPTSTIGAPSSTADLEFPSTPQTNPVLPSTPSADPISKDATSHDNLQLPAAPTSVPTKKAKKPTLSQHTDAEIETWCIICSDDATVRCLGCDEDLYCAKCWKEGHVGPDVGFEERGHRWTKYDPGKA